MSNQTFRFAGVSLLKGATKARFANSQDRIKTLVATGHTDIDIVELPHAMSKVDAIAYLISINFDNGNPVVRAALEEGLVKRQGKSVHATDAVVA